MRLHILTRNRGDGIVLSVDNTCFVGGCKFTDTVARHSLDASSDPREVILGLEVSDYFNGPEDDRDRPGEKLWVFGPELEQGAATVRLYVKLKLDRVNDYVVCFGFHEAEKPITYPYR